MMKKLQDYHLESRSIRGKTLKIQSREKPATYEEENNEYVYILIYTNCNINIYINKILIEFKKI